MKNIQKTALAVVLFALVSNAAAQGTHDVAAVADYTAIGKGLALGLGAIGTGLAQAKIGTAIVAALTEDPSAQGRLLLYFLLPETLVIFGFLALFIIR